MKRSLFYTKPVVSTHVVLIPPDQELLLHVSADGFHEWQESLGRGKPIHVTSGERLKLNVQLAPVKQD